jgi:predicted phage terminase large subunit-like protein
MTLASALDLALLRPREAELELDRVDCEEDILKFLQRGWRTIDPSPFRGGWHLEAIGEHLAAVTMGEIKRLVINVPPRMTKSSLVSVAWPAWTWGQREILPLSGPHVQFLFASYAQSLSERDSVKTRRLIQSPWYQKLWGDRFQMTGDQNAKRRFENNLGGYRLATSVGGSLTGEGGHIIVVDDPHNTIEIESEAQRESTVQWWDEALSTRLNDMATGAYVIIMQRLYENDLTGHVLTREAGDWVHLMLPMEYEPDRHCHTLLGFEDPREEEGELLCPERVSERDLNSLKRRLGPFGVAGQLQQAPTPRGGGIIKADDWQAWPPHVEDLVSPIGKKLSPIAYPEMDFILASIDTAMTEKQENDFSAMSIWGIWRDKHDMPQIMLMEAWAEHFNLHDLVNRIITDCKRRKVDRILIEGKNNGFSVHQEIQRLVRGANWACILEPVKGDKVARAHACQPTFASHQVWAPARNLEGNIVFLKWAQAVIDQCAALPKGSHDDLADTATQAINHMRRFGLLETKSEKIEYLHRKLAPPGNRESIYEVM